MSLAINLPWPSADLSQNARIHWARKAKATKAARTAAFYLVRAVTGRLDWHRVAMGVVFHPPSRRRFDRDGLIGRLKASQDGIADAIGIDDHLFIVTYAMAEPIKGGIVRIALEPARPA